MILRKLKNIGNQWLELRLRIGQWLGLPSMILRKPGKLRKLWAGAQATDKAMAMAPLTNFEKTYKTYGGVEA